MTEKAAHAAPPTICAACESIAQQLAESHALDHHVIKRCDHTAGTLCVLAIGFTRDGAIHQWQLQGPLTDSEATIYGAQFFELMRRRGGVPSGMTRQ
jgi:hypothetical protein